MKVTIFSKKLFNIPGLSALLSEYQLSHYSLLSQQDTQAVLGWGLRPSTKKARAYSSKHGLPFVALEDGFLRSVGLGVAGYPPFSLVVDKVGIYYDTTRPSELEQLILAQAPSPELLAEAQAAVEQIVAYQLSKYNHAPNFSETVEPERSVVLVIDQTFGDMAVKYGQADESHFRQMLEAAISENPQSEIWVKTHPDVISGKKKGYLTQLADFGSKIRLFAEDCNPHSLLTVANKVYCVTSQMGFEALMLGKQVVTFGAPWFAGWGVTDDRHPAIADLIANKRRETRPFLQIFAAAYLQYSRYINPNTGERGTIFDVIDYLHRTRQFGERLRGTLYCVGMSWWKQAVIKPFFRLPQIQLEFVSLKNLQKIVQKRPLVADARLLVWSNGKPDVLAFAEQHNLLVLRMEDGFIRSVGLGANLVAPLSLVIDDLGIYFNSENTSRLEQILLKAEHFSDNDLSNAEALRQKLVASHIGKYNVGSGDVDFNAQGKKIILVPGQVEDDASIKSGSPQIKKNLDLLKKVRELNPTACIVYKPHPDVVSGNRIGNIPKLEALHFADLIVDNVNILDCILKVDEVHTMTSLAGFEALLRGKKVHCYGIPFYAGWGLTEDLLQIERRNKTLILSQLIAATLIYYPLYIDPAQGKFIDANQAINLLMQQKQQLSNHGIKRSWISKQYGKLKQLYRVLSQTSQH